MRKLIYAFPFLFSTYVFAASEATPEARIRFCQERFGTTDALQKIVMSRNNQISFYNQGGLFGGGVCWWHSRFTRAAAYLAIFDPSLPKPSEKEARDIISHLRHRKGIVTVPGYRNLREFSSAYDREVLNKLSDWQRSDGVLKAAWVKGLSGNEAVESENLEAKMDELFERILRGEVVYQKLQMPGIVAHAWLVTKMVKTINGYTLTVVDSNSYYSATETFFYTKGSTSLRYLLSSEAINFVPYTGETGEEEKLRGKLIDECSKVIRLVRD